MFGDVEIVVIIAAATWLGSLRNPDDRIIPTRLSLSLPQEMSKDGHAMPFEAWLNRMWRKWGASDRNDDRPDDIVRREDGFEEGCLQGYI